MLLKSSFSPLVNFSVIYDKEKQKQYMDKARQHAGNSICSGANTGSVVVNNNGDVIGKGYNQVIPEGVKSCTESFDECPRKIYNIPSGTMYDKTCPSVCSEQYAIADAGLKNTPHSTLFMYGHYHLCDTCKKWVLLAGIDDIYLQHKRSDEIKHISRENLTKEKNENLINNLKTLKKS